MSAATGPHGPGELFLGEIREQPEALLRLLEQEAEFEAVTKAMRERRPSVVRLVGHGSSDAAASYGVYAFGLAAGLDCDAGLDLAHGLLRREARSLGFRRDRALADRARRRTSSST